MDRGANMDQGGIFAYSESKLTCHFVVDLLAKRSEKGRKRSKKVTSS